MKVQIGTTSDEYNVLTKTYSLTEYTGSIRDTGSVDILHPVILVNADITNANYAYIPDFGRFYFIDPSGIVAVRRGLTQVSMHVDVLTTYDAAIRACPAVCARTADNSKMIPHLPDTMQPHDTRQMQDNYTLGQFHFNPATAPLILITSG